MDLERLDLNGPSEHRIDITSIIGEGGFAHVYEARNLDTGRVVAVKVLKQPLDDGAVLTERRMLGPLGEHPHIVTVYQVGLTTDGRPFLEMELMRGGSLQERLLAEGPMPWMEAVELLLGICEALVHAHSCDIVHRDITPANVMIDRPTTVAGNEPSAGAPTAKLGDFGVAGLMGDDRPQLGVSWAHAPPEMIEPDDPSPLIDIYMFASTLYTAIAGHPPFWSPDQSTAETRRRVSSEPPPELEGAPPWLRTLLGSCLAKDPLDRPQQVRTLITKLRGGLERARAMNPTRPEASAPVDEPLAGAEAPSPATAFPLDALPGDDPGHGPPPFQPTPPGSEDPEPTRPGRLSRRVGLLVAFVAVLAAVAAVGFFQWPDEPDPTPSEEASGGSSTTEDEAAAPTTGGLASDPIVGPTGSDSDVEADTDESATGDDPDENDVDADGSTTRPTDGSDPTGPTTDSTGGPATSGSVTQPTSGTGTSGSVTQPTSGTATSGPPDDPNVAGPPELDHQCFNGAMVADQTDCPALTRAELTAVRAEAEAACANAAGRDGQRVEAFGRSYTVMDIPARIAARTHAGALNAKGEVEIQGTPGDDLILGTGEADAIFAQFGFDIVCAGAGNDRLWGCCAGSGVESNGDGGDVLLGQAGIDSHQGGFGNDMLLGDDDDYNYEPGVTPFWGHERVDDLSIDHCDPVVVDWTKNCDPLAR